MNEILATQIENTDKSYLSLNINILKKTDLEKEDIFCFFEKDNIFKKVSLGDIRGLSLSIDKEGTYSMTELFLLNKHFPKIEHLRVSRINTLEDFSVLYFFKCITNLSISFEPLHNFNFKEFPTLKNVYLEYYKEFDNIFECKEISRLSIVFYKVKSFEKFTHLTNLKELNIKQSTIKNINDIQLLKKLEVLDISYNRVLNDIEGIRDNRNIKELTIRCCSKISDFTVLGSVSELENLVLENVKELNNLDFIRNLKHLKTLRIVGKTNIINGDLKWILSLLNLTELFIPIKKHYNIELEDLNDINYKGGFSI